MPRLLVIVLGVSMAAGIAASVFVPWPGPEPEYLFVLLPTVIGLGLLAFGMARGKMRDRFLDRHGVPATAVVTRVEPLSWNVNRAAGHPVHLRVDTPDGARTLRDTTGLNGYVVPEGAEVGVRVCPTDPDLFRVEELPGGFRVEQARPRFGPAAATVLVLLVVSSVFLVGSLIEALQGIHRMDRFSYPSLLGVLGVILICHWTRSRFAARALSGRAKGEVTAFKEHQSTDATWYFYTVRFRSADDRVVHKISDEPFDSGYSVLVRIPVWYNPDRPAEFLVPTARRERPSMGSSFLLLFLGLLLAGSALLGFWDAV